MNGKERAAGERHHAGKASAERIAGGSITLGRILAVLAALVLLLLLWWWFAYGAGWIALGAFLALLLGLWLIRAGRGMRLRRGLGGGRTLSLDNVTLTSRRLGLTGRPDRLVKINGTVTPEEWKSSRQVRAWHRAQLGVYFLVIEEETGIRLTHGFIACGDGTRHRVENTDELRAFVLEVAARIREARRQVEVPIPVNPVPGQCRPCGMLGHCRQARL